MGKQAKKILRNQTNEIEESTADAKKNSPKTKRQQLWISIFILFTIFVLATSYQAMSTPMITMYVLLILSLCGSLAKLRLQLSEKVADYISKASLSSMILAMVLFAIVVYQKYIA